jgi:hypothetical protein
LLAGNPIVQAVQQFHRTGLRRIGEKTGLGGQFRVFSRGFHRNKRVLEVESENSRKRLKESVVLF